MKKAILGFAVVCVIAVALWTMGKSQMGFGFAFSVDIGSDMELSDPNPDGLEGFDPGDAYRTDAPAGSIAGISSIAGSTVGPGADGTHRDDENLLGTDPNPDAETSPVTVVPVGSCPMSCYKEYFDLDGYDVVNLQLNRLAADGLTPPYNKIDLEAAYGAMGWLNCIEEVEYLAVSFDDDDPRGWTSHKPERVPVESYSAQGKTYGSSSAMDEIVGINLVSGTGSPMEVDKVFGIASEEDVHPDLAPNPDSDESSDDDVDALDMIYPDRPCDVFLYSADREGSIGPSGTALLPGAIYQEGVVDPVIRPRRDLGLSKEVDIDAFELAWIPTQSGDLFLGLIFSVDEDDPQTRMKDETGGLQPNAIYGSFLDGACFELITSPVVEERMFSLAEESGGGVNVLSIDMNTGTASIIGTVYPSLRFIGGLDFAPDGVLYGASDEFIVMIDITPPCALVEIPLSESLWGIRGMAFRSDGTLFLLKDFRVTSTTQLYQADVATGKVTLIGDIAGGPIVNGMDFDPSGRLWVLQNRSDEIIELDPATAAILNTYSVPYPAGNTSDDFAMTIDQTGRMFITNEYLLEITGYSTGTPSVTVIGPTGYIVLHTLADLCLPFDDIDAITISEDDLFIPEFNQPIIYQNE